MKGLNFKGFNKAFNRLDDSFYDLQTEDEKKLISDFAKSYFGSEDYFNDYELGNELTPSDCNYIFDCLIIYGFAATNIKAFEKRMFSDQSFCHQDFYNIAYFYGFMSLFSENYISLLSLFIEEIKDVSLPKLVQKDWREYANELSEIEVYDSLIKMSTRNVSLILDRVNGTNEVKTTLKRSILNKDENAFVETVVNANVNIDNVSAIITILSIINQIKETLQIITAIAESDDNAVSVGQIKHFIEKSVNDSNALMDDKTLELYQNISKADNGYIPNIDWSFQYSNMGRMEAFLLVIHHEIKKACSNLETVIKLEERINNWPYFKSLYEKIQSGEVIPNEYGIAAKPLSDFRDKFIQEMELPENTLVGAKNTKEFIESSRKQDKWYCMKLYKALVKANLLSYDNDTYYSFIYRMSIDYRGEAEPNKVVWLGKPRDIFYLIYWFCDNGESKIWKKTADFFCLPDGERLNTNGVKNHTKTPSPKMESIIKEISK